MMMMMMLAGDSRVELGEGGYIDGDSRLIVVVSPLKNSWNRVKKQPSLCGVERYRRAEIRRCRH